VTSFTNSRKVCQALAMMSISWPDGFADEVPI
jgi:hypothetical protein